MRKDQIFVLMLVIFLPLTGCFGDAIGEAEADENEDGTNVINNYYNNTTVVMETPEIYSTGGFGVFNWEDNNSQDRFWLPSSVVLTINSNPGEMVNIIQSDLYGVWNAGGNSFVMYTNCSQGATFYNAIPKDFDEPSGNLPGSFDTCVHELVVKAANENQGDDSWSWSFAYQIITVTVV